MLQCRWVEAAQQHQRGWQISTLANSCRKKANSSKADTCANACANCYTPILEEAGVESLYIKKEKKLEQCLHSYNGELVTF